MRQKRWEKELLNILIASNNEHKVAQIRALLESKGISVQSMKEAGFGNVDIPETGQTIPENSLIKAKWLYDHVHMPVLADDSGLEVMYLEGAPGVYSARFAGEEKDDDANNELLLERLKGVPASERIARFVTVLTYINAVGEVQVVEGEIMGEILNEYRGTNGFGYDPLFYVPTCGKTMAEMTFEEKNQHSHRGRAVAAWLKMLTK